MTRVLGRRGFRREQFKLLKDAALSAKGALRRNSGRAFEEQLEASCAWYREQGQAIITRNSPPTTGWGKNMRYTGPAIVDFSGFFFPEGSHGLYGRPIAFDAKGVTGRASYQHPQKAMHQIEYLRDFSRGGVAGLLLHDSALGLTWWLAGRFDRLLAGESVPIRTKNRDGSFTHHLPVVPRTYGPPDVGSKVWKFLDVVEKVSAQVAA